MDSVKDRLRLISSRQNALVKELRRAFHSSEASPDGYAGVEGTHILDEALRSGIRLKAVFFRESSVDRAQRLLPQIGSHTETILLPDDVFESAVLTNSPQGVAGLAKLKTFTLADTLRSALPLLLGVAGLQDPGNLGTIIRSAEAFGATGVLTGEATVSASSPKVIRASAGSVFRFPVVKTELAGAVQELRKQEVAVWATSSDKGTPLQEVPLTGPVAILIGNEGAGLSREMLTQMDGILAIPHSAKVESLNAGVAASIILYEAARQRTS